jgi:hypothetical protein
METSAGYFPKKKRLERFVGTDMDVIVEKAEGNYNEGEAPPFRPRTSTDFAFIQGTMLTKKGIS